MAQSGVADEIFDLKDQISNVLPGSDSMVALKRGGKTIYMKDKHAFVRPRHPKRIEFSPSTTTSVQFGGSQVITEFRIYEQKDIETCDWITLRGRLTKNHTVAVGALATDMRVESASYLTEPAPLWLDRIEILFNGSATTMQTLYGRDIHYALSTIPWEKLQSWLGGNLMYMGSDFRVNNTLFGDATWAHVGSSTPVAGASAGSAIVFPLSQIASGFGRTFVIPIMSSLLDKTRLRGICGDTIFRVYWNPLIARQPTLTGTSAQVTISNPSSTQTMTPSPDHFGGGTISVATNGDCTDAAPYSVNTKFVQGFYGANQAGSAHFVADNLQLVLESEEVLEKDKWAYQRLADSSIVLVKFLEPVVQTFNITLQANVETPLQLTAINGDIAFIQIYVQDVVNRALCSAKALTPDATMHVIPAAPFTVSFTQTPTAFNCTKCEICRYY
jgi:hypothetical protein